MRPLLMIFILNLAFGTWAYASCPTWLNEDLPLCPESDVSILDDSYPTMALIVSDRSAFQFGSSSEFPFAWEFIKKAMTAAKTRPPLFILPVRKETFQKLLPLWKAEFPEFPVKDFLIHAENVPGWTWQQDYFESFFNPRTGFPVIREIKNQETLKGAIGQMLISLGSHCNKFNRGESLPPEHEKKFVKTPAFFGGNIEGLPGGLCLHGDNQPRTGFSEYYCGSEANEVVIESSWLKVGHVDEIISVRKNENHKRCEVDIISGNPDLAIQLLETAPQDAFFDFRWNELQSDRSPLTRVSGPRLSLFCLSTGISLADCLDLKNQHVLDWLRSSHQGEVNHLSHLSIRRSVQVIREKLEARLPGCLINDRPVPQLFWSFSPPRHSQSHDDFADRQLGKGSVMSLLPNPSNLVAIENTLLVPDPQNKLFRTAIASQIKETGQHLQHIDTHEYSHIGGGNLHCSTHSLRICRPRK